MALQVKAGLPVFEKALAFPHGDQAHTVILPSLTHAGGLFAMQGAIRLINQSLALDGLEPESTVQTQIEHHSTGP